jgi:DNA-binding MarR family transcriptional regulator
MLARLGAVGPRYLQMTENRALVWFGTMPAASDPDLLVLLGVRLRSFAPAAAIAETAGLDLGDVSERLERFRDAGLVRFRERPTEGWMLSPEGRAEGERLLVGELDRAGARAAVSEAYRRFLAVNQPMLDVCTDWQLRTVDGVPVVNDHADAAHDAVVLARLVTLDDAVQPVVADLAEALGRFGGYGPRLSGALAKVQGGDPDWFTRPTIDSYHTVWFELHENLLATLGIERATEPLTANEEAS